MSRDAYQECRVLTADPMELVCILYEHAIHKIQDARQALVSGDVAARSSAVSRAIAIISELQGSLDHSSEGSLSHDLENLYHYMRTRLTLANFEQQDGPLVEIVSLLQTLAEGWNACREPGVKGQVIEPQGHSLGDAWSGPASPQIDDACATHSWSA